MRSRQAFRVGWALCMAAMVCAAAARAAADEPAGQEQEARRRRDPLPAGPLLLEQALRGLLEAAPGRETLEDVMRRVADRNQADAEAAQRRQFLQQQAQHFENLLRPLLGAELSYARRCCGSLSQPQRAEVLEATLKGGRSLAERLARLQLDGFEDGVAPPDIRREIHEKVAAVLEPRAAPEEFAAYAREARLRQERRTDAARTRIVAKLDEHLGLTSSQRRAVLDDLTAHWQADWIRELEDHDGVMINNYPPAPDFAASSIEPHLDPIQREQWTFWREVAGSNSVPRSGIDWSELNGLQQGQQRIDPWWRK